MNRLNLIDDFDEVKSVAREIDKGIEFLERKLSSVSRFGLSMKPEETRNKAENLLNNFKEEIDEMKCNVESCLEEQKQILDDTVADDYSVRDFLIKMKREIEEIEISLRSRQDYLPYEPEKLKNGNTSDDEASPEVEHILQNSLEDSSGSNVTILDFYQAKKSSYLKNSFTSYLSPGAASSKMDEKKVPLCTQYKIDKSFNDSHLSAYKLLKPRKLNIADETLRTPGNFVANKNLTAKSNANARETNEITSVY